MSLAALAVRANQIAAGGSGVDPGVLDALADCVNRALRPPARRYDGIGTGDLAALAVTALCLLGERDWLARAEDTGFQSGAAAGTAAPSTAPPSTAPPSTAPPSVGAAQPRFALDPADMLAFMSSNAVTLAEAAIACHDLSELLAAGTVVAALAHLAASALG